MSLAAARKAARAFRVEIDKGEDPAADKKTEKARTASALTVRQLCDDYKKKAMVSLAEGSIYNRTWDIENMVKPNLGSLEARKVTSADIIYMLEASGKSWNVCNRVLGTITVLFDHAIGKRVVQTNPTAGIKLRALLGEPPPVRQRLMLTEDELRILLPDIDDKIGSDNGLTLRISRFAERAAFDPVMKVGTVALSNNNLTATVPGGKQVVALGTTGMKAGKWYFETTFVSGTSSGNAAVGVCPRNEAMDAQVGYDDGQGTIGKFQSSGNVYRDGGTNSGSGAAFNVAGDTVGVAIDATSRTAWFRVNGGVWNGSASNDPATGVGGYPIGGTFPLFPAICSDVASVWTVNFTGPFAAASPTGFIPWSQGSLQLSLGDCADVDLTGAKVGDTLKLSTTGVWKPSSIA